MMIIVLNVTLINDVTYATGVNESDKKEVYDSYIKSVSFIKDNEDYNRFLKTYDNDLMKKYFFEADPLNTEDDWNNMSQFEKFNYYILFVRTQSLITGIHAVKNESELLNGLKSEEIVLGNIKDGDKVIEAVKTVWRWEWQQWEKTCEFVNLYAKHSDDSVTELNDIKEEKEEVKEEGNGRLGQVKLVVILIIVGVVAIVGVIVGKRKN